MIPLRNVAFDSLRTCLFTPQSYSGNPNLTWAMGNAWTRLTKCSWYETDVAVWYGAPPKIEIVYDSVNKWIFSCRLDVDRKKLRVDDPDGKSEEEWAADHFCALLRDAGVLKDGEEERTELGASLGD